jgi:hypothetical protein
MTHAVDAVTAAAEDFKEVFRFPLVRVDWPNQI